MENVLFYDESTNFKAVTYERYEDKPMIVIFPGGGYNHLSTREAIPVSNKFLSMGYNTTIVYYSVAPLGDFIQLKQAEKVIIELSKKHKEIIVLGFSAGGHLAGLIGTLNNTYNVKAMILSYPVISFISYVHEGTLSNFLNGDDNTLENRNRYSIDKRVSKSSVPCFIWTTKSDTAVPYENTLMMIKALKENGVFYRYHIYENGPHGMALADESAIHNGDKSYVDKEVATWVNKADEFIKEVINK